MITLAQSETGIPVLLNELDADPWQLNVLNGTIDLRTGMLGPHRRHDLITRIAAVTYNVNARSALWDAFLTDATGGDAELARFLQRAVGYALQGTASERAFFFLVGPPGTAKSTFVDAIAAALGEYHMVAAFDTWLLQSYTGGNRGDLVRLASARLVTSVEVRKGARFDEGILKAVTGGDAITAAAKYEREITFTPSFALWLAANDAPAIRDDDEGAWTRVRRIPFDHVVPTAKQDRTLKLRLQRPDVGAAILAWAVRGCIDWQQQGLGTSAAIERSTTEYRNDMDRVAGFFAESCLFEASAKVQTTVLRRAYEDWCKEQGIRAPLAGKEFAKRLEERNCRSGKSDGNRVWKGVRLSQIGDESRDAGTAEGRDLENPSRGKTTQTLSEGSVPVPSLPGLPHLVDDAEERAAIKGEGGGQ
jgi:putative DNA primase/helicase